MESPDPATGRDTIFWILATATIIGAMAAVTATWIAWRIWGRPTSKAFFSNWVGHLNTDSGNSELTVTSRVFLTSFAPTIVIQTARCEVRNWERKFQTMRTTKIARNGFYQNTWEIEFKAQCVPNRKDQKTQIRMTLLLSDGSKSREEGLFDWSTATESETDKAEIQQ